MSIWFMNDNHTFVRLDTLPVDAAMDKLETLVDAESGGGFIGFKGDDAPRETVSWKPGEAWRQTVRPILQAAALRKEPDHG